MTEVITVGLVDREGGVREALDEGRGATRAQLFRRAIIGGGTFLAGGLLIGGLPKLALGAPSASQDVEILNFALLLEDLERVDSFHAERTLARDTRSLGDVQVTVVTADAGQSDKRDQRSWKRLSSHFSHVVLSGGHDIYKYDAEGVVEQILKTVDAAE